MINLTTQYLKSVIVTTELNNFKTFELIKFSDFSKSRF